MALFVKLDVTWVDSRKIVLAPMEVRGCHATAMCIAKRTENDGWFPRVLLNREGADDALIDDCIGRGLLEVDIDQVRPSDWLDRNPSKAALEAQRAGKAEAGRKGNHVKYKHGGDYESCPECHPNAQVVAGCDRTSSQASRTLSPDSDSDLDPASDRTLRVVEHFDGPTDAGYDAADKARIALGKEPRRAAGGGVNQ